MYRVINVQFLCESYVFVDLQPVFLEYRIHALQNYSDKRCTQIHINSFTYGNLNKSLILTNKHHYITPGRKMTVNKNSNSFRSLHPQSRHAIYN